MNAPERAASRLLDYLATGVESAAEITPKVVDDPIEGRAAVPSPISQGFEYQIEHFLDRALRMLSAPEQRITAVELEDDEAAGVDDIVVYYDANIDNPDRPPANREYIQVKYKTSLSAILRGASFVDLKEWGGKTTLLEKMSRWWQKCGKPRDVRLTLVTDAGNDLTDPFFLYVDRSHGTIAAEFLTDAKMAELRNRWQNVAGLDERDFASFVRCVRVDTKSASIEDVKRSVLDVARGLGMTGTQLGAALTAVGREIFHSKSRRYTPARLLALLASRGIAPTRLPLRMIQPTVAAATSLAARCEPRFGSLTLDVGTVWGLQTGRFLGLLDGGAPERVHEAFCAAQSALERIGESSLRRQWWLAMGFGWYDPAEVLDNLHASAAIGILVEVLPIKEQLPYLFGLAVGLFADRERDVSLVLTFDPGAAPVIAQLVHELRVRGLDIPTEHLTVVNTLSRAEEEKVLATAQSGARQELSVGLARAAQRDDLLERWLLTFGITRTDEIYELCRQPDPLHPPSVDDVALALMRIAASHDEHAVGARRCLDRISPLLDPITSRVARWILNANATVAELDGDVAARLLLPRAGVGAHVLPIRAHSFDLSDAFVAQANMPTPDHVAALLSLQPQQRAVVGLCSDREWRELRGTAKDDLVYMRHGRPLPSVPHLKTENPT